MRSLPFPALQAEHAGQLVLFQAGADDAEPAGVVGAAAAHVKFPGYHVEVEPATLGVGDNALGPEHGAVGPGVQSLQSGADLRLGELLGSLHSPAHKHLVGVVAVMVMMVVVMVMIVAALVMVVMMLMLMVMVMKVLMFLVVMMMVMLVALLIMVVVMVAGALGIVALVLVIVLPVGGLGLGH